MPDFDYIKRQFQANPPQGTQQQNPLLAFLQAQQMQQQPQGNPMAMFAEALKPQTARHLGIGGMEITPDNPMGRAGGDPFTNGFFRGSIAQQQAGKASSPFSLVEGVLGGTQNPDSGQMALLHAHQALGLVGPQAQIPQGDPQARAFFGKPTSPEPQAQQNPYDNQMNQANFWNALAQQQAWPKPKPKPGFSFGTSQPSFSF